MIILDTNVLSELMRATPDETVVGWIAAQPAASLFTTTITEAEILFGLAVMPTGRRRLDLEKRARAMFDEDFSGRILAFERNAARVFADIAASRRRSGHPIAQLDAQIAAIARATGGVLATRNVLDFEACGISLVDPFAT